MALDQHASDIVRLVTEGALTAGEPARDAIERARSLQHLRSIRSLAPERASQAAGRVSQRLHGGVGLPLAGVPVLVKENIAQAGIPALAGRADRGQSAAAADATVVRRLEEAGAVIIGRATMDELAYGISGGNAHTGQVLHPENPELHPGGSSAGSGSSVAAGIVPVALGTDTAGSVRIPAALCGLVGIRPGTGRCPLDGVAPLSPTLDSVGPLARTVRDAALVLSVLLADRSLYEATSGAARLDGSALALDGVFPLALEPGVAERFARAQQVLRAHDVVTERGELASLEQSTRVSGPIIGAEAAYAWARELERDPDQFSPEVAGLLRKGATILATRYLRAMQDRAALRADVDRLFEKHRWLVMPTTTGPATRWAEPLPQLRFLALTTAFSLSGHPCASLPMGRVDGLPVGLQVVARHGDEAGLVQLMTAIEAELVAG